MARRAESFDESWGRSFEEEWPELARRLDRFLASKGVESWLRADVVQDTAVRLYRRWPKLDRSRPLWNLVVTVAIRKVIDEHRRSSRIDLMADPPSSQADDVAARAIHRIQLADTRSALGGLREEDRRVLLAEIGEARSPDGPRNRTNVRRLRARRALTGQLGRWVPAGIALRLRSLRLALDRRALDLAQHAQGISASLASVAVAATLLFTGVLFGGSTEGGGGPSPVPHTLAVVHAGDVGRARPRDESLRRSAVPSSARASHAPGRTRDGSAGLLGPLGDDWAETRKTYNDTRRSAHRNRMRAYGDVRKTANRTKRRGVATAHRELEDIREESDEIRDGSRQS